jgi:hypothetical protein
VQEKSADARAKKLSYTNNILVATFDNKNPAWENIPEEDEKIEEMRWAAKDYIDFKAVNILINKAADKAIILL